MMLGAADSFAILKSARVPLTAKAREVITNGRVFPADFLNDSRKCPSCVKEHASPQHSLLVSDSITPAPLRAQPAPAAGSLPSCMPLQQKQSQVGPIYNCESLLLDQTIRSNNAICAR